MDTKKILILRHIEIEGPGTLGEFLEERRIPFSVLDVNQDNGAILSKIDLRDTRAAVILGGPMNVYEEAKYPFLSAEKTFIKGIIKEKIPLLGICLGSQLIASVLGAKVKRAPVKEIGWYAMRLEPQAKFDPLLKALKDEIKVFQWHEDTFDVPDQAVLLAKNNDINQAFRFQESAWGFQFHIEINEEMIRTWYEAYKSREISEDAWQGMKRGYIENKEGFDICARSIYERFLKLR